MPCVEAVRKLVTRILLFAEAVARADGLVDQLIEIVDDDPDPQRVRNRIIARQWAATRYKPTVYGNRLDVSVT